MIDKINIVMDATQLDTFQSCDYKQYLRFEMNRGPLVKADPLDKGDLIHHGKEYYYKALKANEPWESAVDKGLVALRMRFATESDLTHEDADRLLRVFEENVTRWRNWDMAIVIVAVEEVFTYVLYEDEMFRLLMTGKIDLLFTDINYTNCPMDTKTYTRDFPLRRWNNQFINYAIATDSDFLFVDRVGLQGLPGEVKKPMSPDQKHVRTPLSFDKDIKNQWKVNTIRTMMRYYDCVSSNEWPYNLTSCDKYNRLCEYYPICNEGSQEGKMFQLDNNFKRIDIWDVSSQHGLEKKND
jgi:hypothetical protein